jgi:hypothetical protein
MLHVIDKLFITLNRKGVVMRRRKSITERRKTNRERVRAWRDQLKAKGGKETTVILGAEAAKALDELMAALGKSHNKIITYALINLYYKVRDEAPQKLRKKPSDTDPSAPEPITGDGHPA